MELKAEQIKKALESFHQRILNTNLAENITETEIMAIIDAISLINSQEQRIGAQDMTISELRQRAEKTEHDADRYAQRIKELTEDVERVSKQCGEIIVECDERDAERLKQVAELTEENERLKGERKLCYKCGKYYISAWSQCPYCLTKPNIANDVRADTVRKMQEKLKAQKFTHRNLGEYVYVDDIDQTAKEMLEGGNE